jgi:hypothetical protein
VFPRCRFNEEKTRAGLQSLSWYHEKWDDKRNIGLGPEHDESSHACLVAGSMIETRRGAVPIESVNASDEVKIPGGYARVSWSGMVKTARRLVRLTLDDGRVLTMTPEHKVFTTRGVVAADALRYDDMVITGEDLSCLTLGRAKAVGYRAAFIENTTGRGFGFGTSAAFTFLKKVASSASCTVNGLTLGNTMRLSPSTATMTISSAKTGLFGPERLAEFGSTSTTFKSSMASGSIGFRVEDTTRGARQTSNTCTEWYGRSSTARSHAAITSTTSMKTRATIGLKTLIACLLQGICRFMQNQAHGSAVTATSASLLRHLKRPKNGTAAQKAVSGTANTRATPFASDILRIVLSAAQRLKPLSRRAQSSAASVAKIETYIDAVPVYDLTVDHHHCYVANGILVSNSDAAGLVAVFAKHAQNMFETKSEPIRRKLKGVA